MTALSHRLVLALLLLFAPAGNARPVVDLATTHTSADDLALLRDATRPFQHLDSAVAAGYVRTVAACLVHEHHGAMGYHHTNSSLMDGKLDPRRPEILLYERLVDGDYRLNGVEFIVPFSAWPRDSVAPTIFGERLKREDNLQFWFLHAWVWNANPDGMFADFHPDVKCNEAARVYRPFDKGQF